MRSVQLTAPGKLVLAGEYAVLDGAPAIVMAVNAGVRVTVTEADATAVSTPTGDSRFVDAALAEASEALGGLSPALWRFEDVGLPDLPSKPGLGGSAAATVAALAAAWRWADVDLPTPELFRRGLAVHRAVQGSGSGVDVAASAYGGVVRYVLGEEPELVVPWRPVVVWTGTSAKTGPRVEAYRAWAGRAAFVEESRRIVGRWDVDPIGVLRENRRLLEGMGREAGVAYLTPEIGEICGLAEAFGGGAKASGAGGGDCVVAVFEEANDEGRFLRKVAARGYRVLDLGLAPGVGIAGS